MRPETRGTGARNETQRLSLNIEVTLWPGKETMVHSDSSHDPFGFTGLTYDDVLLLPGHTDVIPSEADTSSQLT